MQQPAGGRKVVAHSASVDCSLSHRCEARYGPRLMKPILSLLLVVAIAVASGTVVAQEGPHEPPGMAAAQPPTSTPVIAARSIGWHIATLLIIMVLCGIYGGYVAYRLMPEADATPSALRTSIVTGACAALLVPLFLNTISSDLMTSSRSDPLKLLVFTGFCLVAAVSGSSPETAG